MSRYIVARPFRSMGVFYYAGTIIEDLSIIKLSKLKLKDRKILPVPADEEAFVKLQEYLAQRRGLDLVQIIDEHEAGQEEPEEEDVPETLDLQEVTAESSEASSIAEPSAKADTTPPPGTNPEVVKPAVTAPVKATTPVSATAPAATVKPVIKPPIKKE